MYTLKNNILNILCLAGLLTACSGSDDRLPVVEEGYAVRFTASQVLGGQTRAAASGVDGLTPDGHVAVYAWQEKTPAEADKYAYSNSYTFQMDNNACNLAPLSGEMKLPVGNGYNFYALSSNDANLLAPAMETGSRTVPLQNGVDYLMAVSSQQQVESSAGSPIALTFRHLATRVVLTVKPADTDGYVSATGLTASIAPIDSTGSYIDLSKTWNVNSRCDMICWGTEADVTGGTPLDKPNGQVKVATQTQDSNTEFTVSFILLPVAGDKQIPLQFDFTDIKFTENGTTSNRRYTASLSVPNDGLKGGSEYAFTAQISRKAVTFSTSLQQNPWTSGEGIGVDEVIEVDPK